jgi:hypothetical protein
MVTNVTQFCGLLERVALLLVAMQVFSLSIEILLNLLKALSRLGLLHKYRDSMAQ